LYLSGFERPAKSVLFRNLLELIRWSDRSRLVNLHTGDSLEMGIQSINFTSFSNGTCCNDQIGKRKGRSLL
jgi:hypothetical protein